MIQVIHHVLGLGIIYVMISHEDHDKDLGWTSGANGYGHYAWYDFLSYGGDDVNGRRLRLPQQPHDAEIVRGLECLGVTQGIPGS